MKKIIMPTIKLTEPTSTHYFLVLPIPLMDQVRSLARSEQRTIASLIRYALTLYVEAYGKEK